MEPSERKTVLIGRKRPDGRVRSKEQRWLFAKLERGVRIAFYHEGVNRRSAHGQGLVTSDRCFLLYPDGRRERLRECMFNNLRDDRLIVSIEKHVDHSIWSVPAVDEDDHVDWHQAWDHV